MTQTILKKRFFLFHMPFVFVALILLTTSTQAFNSEEHKLMGDWAVSELNRDTTIELPWPTRFITELTTNLPYQDAKKLAVGNPPSTETKGVQDNSYWKGYAQRAGNLNLWIPPQKFMRDDQLVVTSYLDTTPKAFTFGDLMSLYGDYRRTTYCTSIGVCILTHANTPRVNFLQGEDHFLGGGWGWRPPEMESVDYLRAISAGLWPPYHKAGNFANNTAKEEDDYFEAGWWGDEMMRIANTNDWHFSEGAIAWYIGMHRLALYWVNEAINRPDANGNLPNSKLWNNALHAEANALHSLTDLFAFGHVVTSRGVSSHDIMIENSEKSNTAYLYMEHILNMGGATRKTTIDTNLNGQIELTSSLPEIRQIPQPSRNDFLKSYTLQSGDAGWADQEHQFHNYFNHTVESTPLPSRLSCEDGDPCATTPTVVRNLRGDWLEIYGDGRLRDMPESTKSVLKEAVRESVQSLLDAYVKIDRYGATVADIGATGSDYFNALRYIPVYVESDPGGHFNRQWTRYAVMVDEVSGANVVPDDVRGIPGQDCVMPYINGEDTDSEVTGLVSSCTKAFPAVAVNTSPSEPTLISPLEGATGLDPTVTFEWSPAIDPDGDAISYNLMVCEDPTFPQSCGVSYVLPSETTPSAAATASGIGLVLFAAIYAASSVRRRKAVLLLGLILLSGIFLVSCGGNNVKLGGTASTVSFTRTDLTPATTYAWKVVANDGNGESTESTTGSFMTQ